MTIRFAILSFAHYHANFWAQAINASDDAVLVGIWDDVQARGLRAAEEYATAFYGDIDELLDECDAVGITSETVKHADLVERAAAAGKHILLEKPMATTVAEARRIQVAVERAGIIFMQNFPKRYDPINHEVVGKVRSGDLGKVSMVRVRHGNYHLLNLGEDVHKHWFGDPALSGGGALIDEGIHAVDFLLWLLGPPQTVYATISSATLGLPLEDTALMTLTYASGVVAEIATSNTLVAAEESIEIYGTGGSAILSGVDLASRDFSSAPFLKFHRHGDPREQWDGSETVPYFRQGNFHQQGPLYFLRCISEGIAPVATLQEGLQSLMIVEAGYEAARTGIAQRLDFA